MPLNDDLQILRRTIPIPNPLRINHRNRPSRADPQTIRLGAQHPTRNIAQLQFRQTSLEEFPRFLLPLRRRTAAADTQKDVTLDRAQTKLARGALLNIAHAKACLSEVIQSHQVLPIASPGLTSSHSSPYN